MKRIGVLIILIGFVIHSNGQDSIKNNDQSCFNLAINVGGHVYIHKLSSLNSLILDNPTKRLYDLHYDFSLGIVLKKEWFKFEVKQTNFKLLTSGIGFDTFYFTEINKKNKMYFNLEFGILSPYNISKKLTFPNWIKNDAFYQTYYGAVFLYGGSVHYQYKKWQTNLTLLKYRRYSGIGAKEHQLMLSVGYLFF
jgi:hypothetical protein